MGTHEKLLEKILRATTDANIQFAGICRLLKEFGFEERIRGSHHIFTKEGIEEIINIQPKDANSKPYQVKQVRNLITKYKLELEDQNGK